MSDLCLWVSLGPDQALLGDFGVPLRDKVGGTGTEQAQDVPAPIWVSYTHPDHISRGFFSKFSDVIVILQPEKLLCIPPALRAKLWAGFFTQGDFTLLEKHQNKDGW